MIIWKYEQHNQDNRVIRFQILFIYFLKEKLVWTKVGSGIKNFYMYLLKIKCKTINLQKNNLVYTNKSKSISSRSFFFNQNL